MKECYKKAISEAERLIKENFLDDVLPVDILAIVESCGLSVEETSFTGLGLGDEEIAGFIDPEEKIIYVNDEDSENRKVFTIAHELGHWILHKSKLIAEPDKYAILYRRPLGQVNDDQVEKEANCFAGNLLVPREKLMKFKHYDNKTLSALFGVSVDVIGFRKKLNGI